MNKLFNKTVSIIIIVFFIFAGVLPAEIINYGTLRPVSIRNLPAKVEDNLVSDLTIDDGRKPAALSYSILYADKNKLREEVTYVKECGLDSIHIDHFDGRLTKGDVKDCEEDIRIISDIGIPLFVHTWVVNPDKNLINRLIRAGLKENRDTIILPYEAFTSLEKMSSLIDYIKHMGISVGVSINPETPISVLDNLWQHFDAQMKTITVMCVVPGAGGRGFIPKMLRKIYSLRKLVESRGIDAKIDIDGGMTEDTHKKVIDAGADSFNARTLFFKADDLKRKADGIKDYSLNVKGQLKNNSFSIVTLIKRKGKYLVKKWAYGPGEEALKKEMSWLLHLSPERKKYFPEITAYSFEQGNIYYEMPYHADMINLAEQIAEGSIKTKKIGDIIQVVLKAYLKDFVLSGNTKAPADYLQRTVLDKTEIRMEEALKDAPFLKDLWQPEYLTINGKRYRNLSNVLKQLRKNSRLLRRLNPQKLYSTHGDMSFQNILTKGKEFLFVDPRGDTHNDIAYDLAKLAQPILAKFDLLDRGLFTLTIQEGPEVLVDFSFVEENPLWTIYKDLEDEFYDILDNSDLSKYLSKNEPYWLPRMKLIYALNLAGYVLFRLNDKRKAAAFYIQSVILINEFLNEHVELSTFARVIKNIRALTSKKHKKLTLLAACPMSPDVIRAYLEISKENASIPTFIATPRQIDVEGSYMGWNQKEFVGIVHRIADEIGYEGHIFFERDHGGPWQRPQDRQLSLDKAMANAKRTYRADINAGFDILHIDVTVDCQKKGKLTTMEMAERTIELISDCESYRIKEDLPPVAYEIGSDESGIYLNSTAGIEAYIVLLRTRLEEEGLAHVWDNIVYLVADTGAVIEGARQIGEFKAKHAENLFKLVSKYGLLLKQHNTDYMDDKQLRIFPEKGIMAANVGPEFSQKEYEALEELEQMVEDKSGKGSVGFMSTLIAKLDTTNRWKRWFPGVEHIQDLDDSKQREVAISCGRYVQNDKQVQLARKKLYEKAIAVGIPDPARYVIDAIKRSIYRYEKAFNSGDILPRLKLSEQINEKKSIVKQVLSAK